MKSIEDKIIKNISKMSVEHPELSKLYIELNELIKSGISGRSRELKRSFDIKIQNKRDEIRSYEKKYNITREDHLNWS
jgi:hypothetical protein